MIEGVDSMQVLYGIDTTTAVGVISSYVTADAITDWARVVAVRMSVLMHATDGTLDQVDLEWDRRVALGVVMAASGYPSSPRTGDAITGLPAEMADACVFHAGTAAGVDAPLTTGGRVLCVTALGDSVKLAQQRAYEVLRGVHFDGAQYRRDVGFRAIRR